MLGRLKALLKQYREQISYLFFGGLTTVVDWSISFLLYHFWIDAQAKSGMLVHVADVLAWGVAVLFAFFTNRIWVFQSKTTGILPITKELTGFAGGRVFTLLLQELIMAVFVTWLGWNKYVFRLLTAVLVVILNYIISKLLVFRKK